MMVLDVKTASKRVLANGSYPVWSPDGRRVAFVDRCRLWLVPARGGKRTRSHLARRAAATAILPGHPMDAGSPRRHHSCRRGALALLVFTPDGKRHSHVRSIRAAAVRWPRDCGRLFLYEGRDMGMGWIVHGAHGAPRLVRPTASLLIGAADDLRVGVPGVGAPAAKSTR